MHKGIKILAKVIATVLLLLIFLPFSLALLLQIPRVQTLAAGAAMEWASEKLGVEVGIDRLRVGFFNRVEVEGFYVEDYERDTLLFASHAEVSVARLGLFGEGIVFGEALVRDAKFHLRETPRGEMNVKEVVDRMRPAVRKEKKNPLVLRFRNLQAEGLEFWLKRNEPPRYDTGIDWADMRLKDLWGHLSDFTIRGGEISTTIDHLSGWEQSGFRLNNLAGTLLVGDGLIAMNGVEIQTDLSDIHMPTFSLSGDGWEDYKYFIDYVVMEAQVEDSSLSTDDVAYFAPTLGDWHLAGSAINLDVSGTVADLKGRIHSLRTRGGSTLRADLRMKGLPRVDRTRFDIRLHSLRTTAADGSRIARSVVGANLSPSLVKMLSRLGGMELSGRFAGRLSDFSAHLLAATGVGLLRAEATMSRNLRDYDLEAEASTRGFDAGRLLAIKDLGEVSLSASARGSLSSKGPNLAVEADIPQLIFKEVVYDSLRLTGTLKEQLYTGHLVSDKEPLQLTLDASADLSGAKPRYQADLNLRRADLAAMRLNERDSVSVLSLDLVGDLSATGINDLSGAVEILDARYRYNDSLITAPKLRIEALHTRRSHALHLHSPFTDASFNASQGYKEAFLTLKRSLSRYLPNLYPSSVADQAVDTTLRRDDYSSVELRVKRISPLTQAILPGLEVADNTRIHLLHIPASGRLTLDLHSDFIERDNLLALGLDVQARNEGDSLMLDASVGELLAGKMEMKEVTLKGGARDSRFSLAASFADSLRMAADLNLDGRVERNPEGLRRLILNIDRSRLLLDGKEWQIEAPLLELDSARIRVDHFLVHNAGEQLLLDGVASRSREDSILLKLHNFDLSPLTRIASSLGFRISGHSNGFAMAKSALHESEITADIDLDSMAINDRIRVAPLKLLSRWDFEKNRAGLFIINRPLADTVIRGFYIPNERRYLARLGIDSLPMSLLDPMLPGIISETEGHTAADLTLMGQGRKANLKGELRARDLATRIDYTQVTYRVPEVVVRVDSNRFTAYRVPVYDEEGNAGDLDFELNLNHLSNIAYRLEVAPRKMLVLDTSDKDNDLFYGHIYASGQALIRGDKMGVKMMVNASTEDNSTFSMPLSGSTNVSKADFVTFLSADQPDTTDYLVRRRLMFERRNRQKEKISGSMDIDLSLNVHPNVDFQLVIDPQAGDQISGKGEGLLNIRVNPRDNIFEMLGDYVIQEGSYLFTLQNVINKKFLIESGSSIQWTGEPMDAMLNINALYKLKTSLLPLLGASSSADRNANTRQVPVECVIHLGDRLSDPSKEFSIRVPQADSETQTAVANILNTEATIARQFIYLLAFGSFYPENATASNDNIGAVASATTGFEFLSNQMGNLLSGDDYDIILRYRPETEMTGEEVDFGLSTNLINDRLLIEVEGNYIIDNKQATTSRMSNFMGEAYITWMIDRAGNLKLRGFTQTIDRFDETQGLQETGIGIYYKEDFETFKDWRDQLKARFSDEQRRQRRAERQARKAARRATNSGEVTFNESEVIPTAEGTMEETVPVVVE